MLLTIHDNLVGMINMSLILKLRSKNMKIKLNELTKNVYREVYKDID